MFKFVISVLVVFCCYLCDRCSCPAIGALQHDFCFCFGGGAGFPHACFVCCFGGFAGFHMIFFLLLGWGVPHD